MLARLLQRRSTATASALLARGGRQQLTFCAGASESSAAPPAPSQQQQQQQEKQPPVATTTWNTLLVGEIVALAPHPAAERLSVCHVDVGNRENLLQIVCGAPNVRAGARVPVATVGTRLALKDPASGDVKLVKIKKSKLRGEVSQGMICSEAELGLADESDGILILEDDAPVGSLVQDWGSVARRLVAMAEVAASESKKQKQSGDAQ